MGGIAGMELNTAKFLALMRVGLRWVESLLKNQVYTFQKMGMRVCFPGDN
jgi:hypothetical protein